MAGFIKRTISFFKALKRFPFEENEELVWNKQIKIDAAFSQVSRKTDLAFEDMGILRYGQEGRWATEERLGFIPSQS